MNRVYRQVESCTARRALSPSLLGTMLALAIVAGDVAAQGGLLEEVVVTARKREEGLQDAPIAVSAFSGESLEFRGVTEIGKLDQFTPNLVLNKSPTNSGVTNAAVYIRGIGQNDFVPTIDPGVGIYVDEVYLGRSVGAVLDLIDIERVEVLRGPQGTLFGRNTLGGAISIHTAKPDEEFGGKADVRFGTDGLFNLRGTVNVPVNDEFFMRFSAATFNQDGYVDRPDGVDLGNDDTVVARASARWVPTDNFELTASMDYSRDRENGPAFVITGIQPLNVGLAEGGGPSQTTAQNTIVAQLNEPGGIAPGGTFFDPAAASGFPFNFLACFDPANLNNPNCYNQRYIDDGSKDANFGTDPARANLDVWGGSVTMKWNINDNLELKSITAYRTFEGDFNSDQDGGPQTVSHLLDLYQQDQFSQEVQLLGSSFDNKLDWILGAYYFTEEGDNINPVTFSQVQIQSGGIFDNQSWAVFAQGTWHVTEKLDLTFGMRYTEDTRDYLPDQFFEALPIGPLPFTCPPGVGGAPPCGVGDRVVPFETVTQETSEWVPMVNIAYQWTEDLLTYFTYSEGFKSGGFTQRIFPPEPSLPDFDPEFVTSFELGFKYTGFDDKLRLNVAGYFTDYTDLQLLVADPSRVGPFVTNAGDAEIKGIEIETIINPFENFFITGSAGLTDAERTALAGGVQGLTLDSRFENISEWNANLQLYYEFSAGNWGRLTPRFEWAFRTEYGTNSNNVPRDGAGVPQVGPFAGVPLDFGVANPALLEDDLHLINASIRWEHPTYDVDITGGVDNITDEEFRVWGNYQDAFGFTNEVFDRGRQWYIQIGYQF